MNIVMNDVVFEVIEEVISAIMRSTYKVIAGFGKGAAALMKGAVIGIGWALKTVFVSIFKSIFGVVAALVFGIFAVMRR